MSRRRYPRRWRERYELNQALRFLRAARSTSEAFRRAAEEGGKAVRCLRRLGGSFGLLKEGCRAH